jgi:hypothetical protein
MLLCAQSASAQARRLQMDLNDLSYQFRNVAGAPAPFPGTTATGTFQLLDQAPSSILNGVLIRTGGSPNPYIDQPFTGSMTDVVININLLNGAVTGGSILVDLNGGPSSGGDRYSASILAGGSVQNSLVPQPGAFTIESTTGSGSFSDNSFAGVAVADFSGSALTGDFLNFKILPSAQGSGFADVDLWVNNIPAPGAAGLLAMAGCLAARRRR